MEADQPELRVVLPGDVIPVNDEALILGPGLRQDGENVVATKAGLLRHIETGNRWWIESNQRRYIAAPGESVLGTVTARLGEYYRVDIGTAHSAILPALAFEGATKRNRPNLTLRSLVYCRVAMANRDMEAELECVNPATGKADGFGELQAGYVFKCSLGLCRKLLDPSTPILSLLGEQFPYEMAVGMNGRVWVNSNNHKDTILISNAIQNSEYLSEDECRTMVESLLDKA
ncbi:exosome non-catalytic core subunit rrp40 [Apophysomyces sp. BC1034]|nr:exosome non-catalytic core subunit rrp40 [Apophysomyces sp. BC1015]KAG0183251.1 exosome non-catalytic core subunit rrp40 [Apophysomyces sp. BC1021]KAG0194058.1 exosome non-catalytic core subunit rrp40 [Apophysomyces sp. BC1034]